jgi:hypothetical protein
MVRPANVLLGLSSWQTMMAGAISTNLFREGFLAGLLQSS